MSLKRDILAKAHGGLVAHGAKGFREVAEAVRGGGRPCSSCGEAARRLRERKADKAAKGEVPNGR